MIADAAGVSRITVWKVFNNHPGVSSSLRKVILDTAVQMGYPLADEVTSPAAVSTSEKISGDTAVLSVVVSRPDTSIFWMNIIHEIAKEASERNYSLLYTYVPSNTSEDYELPPQLTNGSIQGIIVLNIYDMNILKLLNDLPLPKVFLDIASSFPLESLTGDLLLLDGKHAVEQITETLIQNGKKRLGFIGDINYALTNKLRYEGFLTAMEKNHLPVDTSFCHTHAKDISAYVLEIQAFLSSLGTLPDAFVCASDFVAHSVYQYLTVHDYMLPEDIALTGFDNQPDLLEMNDWLTTVDVNTSSLGRRLLFQLVYRIEQPDADYETLFLKPHIVYRESTN